jgi:CBS domain-containing protein
MQTVADILNEKGRHVFAAAPGDSVFDAIKTMSDKGIGGMIVMDGEKLVGIMTERDYARKVVLEGKSSRNSTVSEIMTGHVLCVTPEQTIDECMALMTDKRARHLPVLENEKVVGVISIGDLVKAVIHEQQILIDQLQNYITS